MQKFNSISSFIAELEDLAQILISEDSADTIQSSTSIKCSDFIDSISNDEWSDISDIIDTSRLEEDIHKQDEYLYKNLSELGYTDDEISDIITFAEVY